MAISFLRLWENIDKEIRPEDNAAAKAIRFGNNIRSDFWDDFLRLCNDADHLAVLLDVSPEQIIRWSSKVKEELAKIDKEEDDSDKTKIINTGLDDHDSQ